MITIITFRHKSCFLIHFLASTAYSLIAQQQMVVPPTSAPNSTILYANNNNNQGKGKGNSKTSMLCTNCSKTNHAVETYYFKHGFPPGYRNKNPKSYLEFKTIQTQDKEGVISKEDYQHLLHLLHQSRKIHQHSKTDKVPNPNNPIISGITTRTDSQISYMWILDSGASHHVCSYIKCFSDIKVIDFVYIHLPNGTRIDANFYGTIILDPSFHLHNIYFIHEFRFSLISISKLCHTSNYSISFLHNSCYIQNVSTKQMIG